MAESFSAEKWNENHFHYMKSFLGSVVEIVEYSGNEVIGNIREFDANRKSIALIKTTICGKYIGNYVVFEDEIEKWRIKNCIKIRKVTKNRAQSSRDSSKVLIPVMNGMEEEEEIYGLSSELESIDLNEDDNEIEINTEVLKLKASLDIKFVDKLDVDLENAIKSIMSCDSVGFELFGDDISREGSVDLFVFANEDAIYVFEANKQMIPKMRSILESEKLKKIMYSCRLPSDALFHLFNIKLENVIDIRIADYYLQKRQLTANGLTANGRKFVLPKLRSLQCLFWDYLNIKIPKFHRNVDYRQLSVRVENIIRVKTIFLREISAIINYRLMKDVFVATKRCLHSLRSSNDIEFHAMKEEERELDLIENPLNLCEENEKRIWNLSTIRIPLYRSDCNGSHKSFPALIIKNKH